MRVKTIFNSFFCLIFLFMILGNIVYAQSFFGPEINKDNYAISTSSMNISLEKTFISREIIKIENKRDTNLRMEFSTSREIENFIELELKGLEVPGRNNSFFYFNILGKETGNFSGFIHIKGDVEENIALNLEIVDYPLSSLFLIEVTPIKKIFNLNKDLRVKTDITKLKPERIENLTIIYSLIDLKTNESYLLKLEEKNLSFSMHFIEEFKLPDNLVAGEYILLTTIQYHNKEIRLENMLFLKTPFLSIKLFGFIPLWVLFLIAFLTLLGVLSYFLVKWQIEKKKKYKMKLDTSKIPKKTPGFFRLGKIAEKNIDAFLEPNKLTTHSIIAGATGGGKSITAQVIIEEALLQNIAVVVFDPTAQWSGMLRKCEDKKMMAFYPEFGLKPKDARGFPGNIREVRDAREIIDINRYVEPGHIQIFTMNKLDPSKIDIFIANVIREIFKSDPKESPDLKVILVFDEVHRLLSKFGGSGEGFLQIERGCREFRKWGIGIMLVSQVLSDFVGEIKANISTEVQMRTRDEGDLNRIKTKYGEEFLQSLVKASSGVGMFVNPAYNRASPYFIHFRPILHNTRRLSDEELEKYNKYNDIVDDLGYQIEQLEEEKIDVFDLKMELKLVKDKIMTGNFSVVDIYLEGLTPRVNSQWEKLGKKPKKRVIKLADINEIKASVEEAKKERAKAEKAAKAKEIKTEEKKEKEEKIEDKILTALTFDNGLMVSSLKELKSILPNMDNEIFNLHVNEKKNDIAKWVEQISKEEAEKIALIKTKKEMIVALENIGKKQPENTPLKEKTEGKSEDKEKSEKEKPEGKTEAKQEKEKTSK
jgi:hypothetical protein